MKGISLFSGAGGDTLGMTMAGINVHRYCELIPQFCMTHKANFPKSKLISHDITKISDEKFDTYKGRCNIIFGGFVCKSFSSAGKKDPNDPRSQLYLHLIRATKSIEPNYVIGENVKGLLTQKAPDGELFIDKIRLAFEEIGYTITYKILNAKNYGVPQARERLIILGVRGDRILTFPPPIEEVPNLINIVTFDMTGAIKIPKEIFDFDTIPSECILRDETNDDTDDIVNIHPYLKLKAETIKASYNKRDYTSLLSFGKRISPIHCEIIDIRNPSKTIICTYDHQPRLFVPLKNANGYYIRCLLPDELKRIQGFPENFIISGTLKQKIIQIGNAVPPPLIQAIVEHILK